MPKDLIISIEDDIFEKLEYLAKKLGLTNIELARYLLGEHLYNINISYPPIPAPPIQQSDPIDILLKIAAGAGMIKCKNCSLNLSADEIKINGDQCFKCKPDTRALEF